MKQTDKKFQWKLIAAIAAGIILLFQVFVWYVKSNDTFKVTHFPVVEQTTTESGGYVAGALESYKVDISPALAFEKAKEHNGWWVTIGMIILILIAAFASLVATNVLEIDSAGASRTCYVGLCLVAGCWFGAHSSIFASNYVELSPEKYFLFKDNLAELFNKAILR